MKLNEQQEEAANWRDLACFTTACPGSGKSRLLVERTARLVESGVNPYSIVVITFTNKAAKSLVDRLSSRLGDSANKLFVGTFHRLCLRILRKYGARIGYNKDLIIISPDDQVDLILQIARQFELEITKPEAKNIAWHVNDYRENLQSDVDLIDRFEEDKIFHFHKVAVEYEKRLLVNNQIDFTGMLSSTVKLLQSCPDVLQQIQGRLQYLMCDEGQDSNLVQYELINLLMAHNGNIFIVADENQSIYAFRGSRAENITDFIKKWNPKILTLNKNYRSTPQILKYAEKLINHNPTRDYVRLVTDNANGPEPQCVSYVSDIQEADKVALTIKQLVNSGQCEYKDCAVLYRMNSMSRAVEMAMISHKINHVVIGNFSFFDRKECLDCLAMLRFMINRRDGISFHRFANKPRRGMGDTTIGKIEKYVKDNNVDIFQAMKEMKDFSKAAKSGVQLLISAFDFDSSNMNVGEILNKIVTNLNYKDYLDNEDADSAEDRWENVQEIIRDAARFSQDVEPSISRYLDQIMLMTSNDKEATDNAVSLMSSHGAKGLEFKCVFLVGVEEGIMPHKRAVDESEDGINEERRIFYVSITRPHYFLQVSHCKTRQEGFGKASYRKSQPSRFLYEAEFLQRPEYTPSTDYSNY